MGTNVCLIDLTVPPFLPQEFRVSVVGYCEKKLRIEMPAHLPSHFFSLSLPYMCGSPCAPCPSVYWSGKYGIRGYPHKLGLLLHGPPGTGKTSMIKALAHHTKRHIVNVPLARIKTNQVLIDWLIQLYRPRWEHCEFLLFWASNSFNSFRAVLGKRHLRSRDVSLSLLSNWLVLNWVDE